MLHILDQDSDMGQRVLLLPSFRIQHRFSLASYSLSLSFSASAFPHIRDRLPDAFVVNDGPSSLGKNPESDYHTLLYTTSFSYQANGNFFFALLFEIIPNWAYGFAAPFFNWFVFRWFIIGLIDDSYTFKLNDFLILSGWHGHFEQSSNSQGDECRQNYKRNSLSHS